MSSLLPVSSRTLLRVLAWLALWPLLAALGVWVSVAAFLRLAGRLLRARHALSEIVTCPRGHPNSVVGRWLCDRCGSEYLGWVGECAVCGDESADWLPCERCSLAIALPWRPRR